MKYINIILVGALIGMTAGCSKVLDVDPQQSIDAGTALQTDQDVDALVVGSYSIMAGGALYGTNLLMLPDLLASEGYCSWRGTFQGPRQVATKTMTRDNSEASRTWTAAYRAINNANLVLENLNIVKDNDLKTQLEGEALAIRGMLHFELVRLYALPFGATASNTQLGVVIKTKATTTEEQAFERLPRNNVAEVYNAVIADLTRAASILPDDNGTRIDRFVALAMLSRVYLQQGNYQAARAAANEVISSGKYSINAAVAATFTNKNTNETIWEIQQNDQNNAGQSNDGMATFFASLPGIGRADVRMITSFINGNYPANDLRISEWYYVGTGARPGNTYCGKWKAFAQNLPIIRINEMYLTRAECNIRLGGAPLGATPAEDLAQVRNSIRTNSVAPANPTLDNVLSERTIELAFEGLRIHDLRRLRRPTGSFEWNADRLVFPIPAREVDATEGILVQNPGY